MQQRRGAATGAGEGEGRSPGGRFFASLGESFGGRRGGLYKGMVPNVFGRYRRAGDVFGVREHEVVLSPGARPSSSRRGGALRADILSLSSGQ